MPFEVAPAPVPSWERAEKAGGSVGREGEKPLGATSAAVPKSRALDTAFLCRLHRTVAWFGTLATFIVASATQESGQAPTLAFVSGLLLGWALLAAQSFLVGRTMSVARSKRERSRKMMWWLLVPLKYLVVAALLGWLLNAAKLPATWLALGFGIVQLLMFAKVAGLVLGGTVRTVRQVYIEPGAD